MMQVPTYDQFMALAQRVDAVERENAFLRSCLLTNQWITRKQTALALGVSEQTVKRLEDKQKLLVRKEGKKRLYEVTSVRSYLTDQHYDNTVVDERVLRACATLI